MYDYKVIAKEIKVFLSAEELFVYTPASEPLEIRNTFVWLIPRTAMHATWGARVRRRLACHCYAVAMCAASTEKDELLLCFVFLFLWQHVSHSMFEWFCTLDFYLYFISIEKVVQRIHTGITSTTFFIPLAALLGTWCDEISPSWFLFCRWKSAAGRDGKSFNLTLNASHFRTFDLSNST